MTQNSLNIKHIDIYALFSWYYKSHTVDNAYGSIYVYRNTLTNSYVYMIESFVFLLKYISDANSHLKAIRQKLINKK